MISLTRHKSVIAAAVLAFIVLSGVTGRIVALNRPVGGEPALVEIGPGMTAAGIGRLLEENGLIRSGRYYSHVSRLHGLSRAFKAGKHIVDPALSTTAIARLLTHNPSVLPDIRVTVIEGLSINETASALALQADIDSVSFTSLANDSVFARKLGIDNNSLEGYLYPDTYFIRPGTTAQEMIARMTGQFRRVFADSLRTRATDIGLTVLDTVILASLIELEAVRNDERPIVSQVFHRRLQLNRPLEANPTIQYVIGEKRRVLNGDLDIDSPYNTYTHAGLPPGPIASPGLRSILAALYPADTKYLYFVSDGAGGHVFSRTLAEHTRAVRKYRQDRRRSRTLN